jgi:quercetin dioxygenase-like cupin family protein
MALEAFTDDGTMVAPLAQFDLAREIQDSEQKKPWTAGHYAKTLFKKSDFRILLIAMDKGAVLKEHHADGSISVQVLQGSIRFTAEGRDHTLQTLGVLTLAASIKHEVEALEPAALLLTIAWPDDEKLQGMKHRGYGT